jgi:hypothetical protein
MIIGMFLREIWDDELLDTTHNSVAARCSELFGGSTKLNKIQYLFDDN